MWFNLDFNKVLVNKVRDSFVKYFIFHFWVEYPLKLNVYHKQLSGITIKICDKQMAKEQSSHLYTCFKGQQHETWAFYCLQSGWSLSYGKPTATAIIILTTVQGNQGTCYKKNNGLNIVSKLIKLDQMWCNLINKTFSYESKQCLTVSSQCQTEWAMMNNWSRSAHHHCRWKCELCSVLAAWLLSLYGCERWHSVSDIKNGRRGKIVDNEQMSRGKVAGWGSAEVK